ncbi:MAG: hypothetical protein QOI95_2423 [Acidimicrobiaceae bacterium]|jgi:hypothetical protein
MKLQRVAAVVLVATLVFTACGDDRAAAPTVSESVVTTSTSTTTGSAATAPTDTLSASSRLGVDRIGPVRVGMTVDEARAAAGIELLLEDGPYCDELHSTQIAGLSLLLIDGHLAVIAVSQPTVRTTRDLRIGSTEQDVLDASPTADVRNPGESQHRVVVRETDPSSGAFSTVFDVSDGVVFHIAAGLRTSTESDEACA